MKKIDLGQTITILANVGVIAGVVFLAFELNQNNKLLRAEADYNYYQGRVLNRETIVTDPDYAAFFLNLRQGGILTELDTFRLRNHIEITLLGMQYEYFQIIEGNSIDEIDTARDRWKNSIEGFTQFNMQLREIWPSFRSTLRPEFVSFFEERVIS